MPGVHSYRLYAKQESGLRIQDREEPGASAAVCSPESRIPIPDPEFTGSVAQLVRAHA
jgi:hypothetical protein